MPYENLTDSQKSIIQKTLDEEYPHLKLTVQDHNGEPGDGQEDWAACTVVTYFRTVIALTPDELTNPQEKQSQLLSLRAADAAMDVQQVICEFAAKYADPFVLVENNHALRKYIKDLAADGLESIIDMFHGT